MSDGITGESNLVGGEESLHTLISHADCVGALCQQFVGHAGVRVLLLNERRNAAFLRRFEHRPACISANADGNVGLELAENLARFHHTFE